MLGRYDYGTNYTLFWNKLCILLIFSIPNFRTFILAMLIPKIPHISVEIDDCTFEQIRLIYKYHQ